MGVSVHCLLGPRVADKVHELYPGGKVACQMLQGEEMKEGGEHPRRPCSGSSSPSPRA